MRLAESQPPGAAGRTLPVGALLLADARLPAGDHAHSGGVEAAVADGRVADLDTLAAFLRGRLWTVGLTEAGLVAAAAGPAPDWGRLDTECSARIPSPTLRQVSRALGRQLLRVARRTWPAPCWARLESCHGDGPHRPLVAGAAAGAAGLSATDAALVAAYGSVAVPATAALRLLGLDPYAVSAALADLGDDLRQVAALAATGGDLADLPAAAAPVIEQAAERHDAQEGRLFAS